MVLTCYFNPTFKLTTEVTVGDGLVQEDGDRTIPIWNASTSGSLPNGAHDLVFINMRIGEFMDAYTTTLEAGILTGMKQSEFAYHPKGYFTEEEAMPTFGYAKINLKNDLRKIPKRFRCYYCTHHGCSFSVGWAWDQNEYYIKQSVVVEGKTIPFCLSHSHQTNRVNVDGYEFIKRVEDLTDDERQFISDNAYSPQGIPTLRVAMGRRFRGHKRDYDAELIRRVRDATLDRYYGPDRHQFGRLKEDGVQIIKEGGVWKEGIDHSYRLNKTMRQTAMQAEFAKEFGALGGETE